MIIAVSIVASSLFAMICLVGWRLWLFKGLTKEQIYREIVSSDPFFSELEKHCVCFFQTLRAKKPLAPLTARVYCYVKVYYSKFSHYINGKHFLEKNGCKGYWKKLNGCKKDSPE